MESLTTGQIIEIHDEIIARTGGEPGVLNRGNLEFVVAQVTEGFTDRQAALPTQAARLLSGIIKGHPFVDGNKRTGLIAGDVLLRLAGRWLAIEPKEGVEFVLAVARGEVEEERVEDWLTGRQRQTGSSADCAEEAVAQSLEQNWELLERLAEQ